ncbi:GTPase [Marinobacter zhejiangensis]|uniref:GTPase n=1 Tax=Marinobacter zhejiangensis TaxID=488535 RepID=A0A1I4QIG9_9GAMM|nr:GTPase [Marinobacter zhejiangensis]SFM39423.1 hypothetical protein SAMN04487963_2391 [Marinobacter zhejiangensis]
MTLTPDLTIPEQKLTSLSFADASPKAIRDWTENLPMANIGETSRQLYHAIIELNQLFIAPQPRFQLLELIRPKIRFVCNELSRHYLGHSVALPEKQRKIANLSQALQLHLANGYKQCVIELSNDGFEKNRKAIAASSHRAISELAATIVRAYQLYCPSPSKAWLECHRLFRFAQRNKIADLPVGDDTLNHRTESSVGDCYKRLLLLGCSRPNQLRQNEVSQVYDLFENWTDLTSCTAAPDSDQLFLIHMEHDAPPIYSSLVKEETKGDGFGFDTQELSDRIAEYLHQHVDQHNRSYKADFPLPPGVNDTLLAHLSQALGVLTKRNFNRMSSHGSLEVCVGLTAAHFYIAGQKSFVEFVDGHRPAEDESNTFIRQSKKKEDAWAGAYDAGPSDEHHHHSDIPIDFRSSAGKRSTVEDAQAEKHRPAAYKATLVNTSPGGYCVSWDSSVPSSMQAGEILGVREQSSHPWSIAIVRWIRQVRNQGTQVGIELLAPSAAPCGVKLIQKVGHSSEYLRGLLLPEISAIGQAATLITPRLPFQSGSRVVLLHDNREDQGQLTNRVSATGSISQFELKLNKSDTVTASTPSPTPGTSEDEFDSLWPSL